MIGVVGHTLLVHGSLMGDRRKSSHSVVKWNGVISASGQTDVWKKPLVNVLLTAVELPHTVDVTPSDARVSKRPIRVVLGDNSRQAISGVGVPGHPTLTWLVLLFLAEGWV